MNLFGVFLINLPKKVTGTSLTPCSPVLTSTVDIDVVEAHILVSGPNKKS